jgi:hypothetical protein
LIETFYEFKSVASSLTYLVVDRADFNKKVKGVQSKPLWSLSLAKCFDFDFVLECKLLAKLLKRCHTFGKGVVTVNAFFVELLYGDNRVVWQVRECLDYFVGHNSNTVLDELRVLVRGFNDDSFVGSLEQLVNPGAH